MGRTPCCDKAKVKRGSWSSQEDATLKDYIQKHGTGGNWIALPRKAGLNRCGKSCRLRWLNYLRPNIKRGSFTEEEDHIICSLYSSMGSRWSLIASRLPGRTDNDVKNYWNTKLKKKLLAGKTGAKGSNNHCHCDASDFNNNNHMATGTANDPNLAEFFHCNETACSPHLVASSGASPPPPTELISYQQHWDPQRLVGDQTKFPVSDFVEVSNLGASGCNGYGLSPSSQEIPGLPASSSLALENGLVSWPRNGLGVLEDEISLDFGSESLYELLTDFDSQLKMQ